MGVPRIWFPNPPTGGLDASDRTLLGLGFPLPSTGPGVPTTYSFARTPLGILVLEMDYCGNVFGVAPCTASGVPCFNTFPTCQDKPNYRNIGRKYKYSSSGAGLPYIGPRPYLKSVRPLPTEIKTSLTVNSRLTAELNDEPDRDLETDPYYMDRPELFVQGGGTARVFTINKPALNFTGAARMGLTGGTFNVTYPCFYEVWFRAPNTSGGNPARTAVANGVSGLGRGHEVGVSGTPPGGSYYIGMTDSFMSFNTKNVSPWVQYIVALWVNPSTGRQGVTHYLNGEFSYQFQWTHSPVYWTGMSLYLGGPLIPNSFNNFIGDIALFRGFNGAVNQQILDGLWNGGAGRIDPSAVATPIFNLTLQEGSGNTITESVRGLTGSIAGAATWTTASQTDPNVRFVGKEASYWRRFISRNRNYKGRIARYYEGVLGQPEGDFVQKWHGAIENITVKKGSVYVEAVDLLKKLGDTEIPPKVECKLVTEIDEAVLFFTLTSLEKFPETDGYVRIDDEIIHYATANQNTKQLENCTRGAFSTTPASHKAKTKVQVCRYYPPSNPWDLLLELLRDGDALGRTWSANTVKSRGDRVIPSTPNGWEYEVIGGTLNWRTGSSEPTWTTPAGSTVSDGDIEYRCIDPAVDLSSYQFWKGYPGEDLNFTALISVPTKLDKLYFEVVELLDSKSWVGEDLRITVRRNLPNMPSRYYHYLSDEANISFKSPSVDMNEKSRVTRVLIYWDKPAIDKDDDLTKYRRLDIAVDGEAESSEEYNEVIEKKFLCRWINSSDFQEEIVQTYVKNLATRQVWRMRDAAPLLTFETDIKDGGIKTGEWARITTDELLEWTGDRLVNADFQIVYREPKEKTVAFKALKMHNRRIGFVAPNTAPDWDAAESTDKEYAYISDTKGELDHLPGYFIW